MGKVRSRWGPARRSISRREIVDLDPLLSAPCGSIANLAHIPSAGSTLTIEGCGRSREVKVVTRRNEYMNMGVRGYLEIDLSRRDRRGRSSPLGSG